MATMVMAWFWNAMQNWRMQKKSWCKASVQHFQCCIRNYWMSGNIRRCMKGLRMGLGRNEYAKHHSVKSLFQIILSSIQTRLWYRRWYTQADVSFPVVRQIFSSLYADELVNAL